MTPQRAIWLVAMREIRERVRSRAFMIGFAITLVALVAAILIVPRLVDDDDGPPTYDVGVVGESSAQLVAALESAATRSDVQVRAVPFDGVPGAEAAILDGDLDAALVDGRELVVEDRAESTLLEVVGAATEQLRLLERLAAAGLSPQAAAATLAPGPDLEVRALNEPAEGAERGERVVAFAGTVIMFTAIIIFASMVLNGVIAEKSSRVVEVLLASIRPRHLLAGKVLGIGLLGFGQMALLVVAGVGTALATGVVEIPTTTLVALGSTLLWFVLGYAFYAVVYAAAGALVSGLEDAQNVATPVGLFTGVMYFFSIIAVTRAEDVLAVRAITLLPPVAPFALPGRASLGTLEAWELAVAVVLMLAAIYAMVRLAGRLYAGSILTIGARVRLRDAWRSSEL